MSIFGIVMDGLLIALILTAIGFGLRLEKKLTALREGQASFGLAVADLNAAASKAHAALAELRAAGEETDMLHERILAARQLKTDLENLTAKGRSLGRAASPRPDTAVDVIAAKVAAIQPPASTARLLQALADRRPEDVTTFDAPPRNPGPRESLLTRPSRHAAPEDDLFEPERLRA